MDDGGVTEVMSAHTVGSCPGLGQAARTVEMFHPQLVAGQDHQHHRQADGVRNHLLCGGGHVHMHDGDGLGAVLAGCTEEYGTDLKISQMT